jgi:GNAT superfamily N-acetyltransferase
MIVRPATAADAAALATVHVRSWQAAYRGLLPQQMLDGLSVEQRTEQWRTILAEDAPAGRATFVAVGGDDVLGFANLAPSRDDDTDPGATGELIAIYARPTEFGTGVGRALMAAALEWFAGEGYREASLWVLDGNARAIGFYEHSGWTPDGTRKEDVLRGHPVTELRYRRAVTA